MRRSAIIIFCRKEDIKIFSFKKIFENFHCQQTLKRIFDIFVQIKIYLNWFENFAKRKNIKFRQMKRDQNVWIKKEFNFWKCSLSVKNVFQAENTFLQLLKIAENWNSCKWVSNGFKSCSPVQLLSFEVKEDIKIISFKKMI